VETVSGQSQPVPGRFRRQVVTIMVESMGRTVVWMVGGTVWRRVGKGGLVVMAA